MAAGERKDIQLVLAFDDQGSAQIKTVIDRPGVLTGMAGSPRMVSVLLKSLAKRVQLLVLVSVAVLYRPYLVWIN